MTAVERYITSIKRYKEIGGDIDDVIVLADTLLLELEQRQIKEAYNIGYKDAQANHINDAEQYYEQLKQTS